MELYDPEKAAALAGVNELDLLDWVETGKIRPTIRVIKEMPFSPGPHFQFSREDVKKIRDLANGIATKENTAKPATPLKAWTPDAKTHDHYTPAELARAWGLSLHTIRRLFEDEAGVMKIGRSSQKKRKYVTMRIPPAVALRVYRRLSA
jgi:hypothetical protein